VRLHNKAMPAEKAALGKYLIYRWIQTAYALFMPNIRALNCCFSSYVDIINMIAKKPADPLSEGGESDFVKGGGGLCG